jgi:hypothetical protein
MLTYIEIYISKKGYNYTMKPERVALLDKDEARVFYDYATKESTPQEKEELKNDLAFYKSHCKKTS